MKEKRALLIVLFAAGALVLFGCIQAPSSDSNANSALLEVQLYKVQIDYNALNEQYTDALQELADCTSSKAIGGTTNSSDLNVQLQTCLQDKKTCNDSLSTCTSGQSTSSATLSTCIGQRDSCNASLSTCQSDKAACDANNVALQQAIPNTKINHWVAGNFFTEGSNKYVNLSGYDGTIKKVIVGMDYNGGTDPYFADSVSPTYSLNRLKWFTFSSSDGGQTYTSDSDGRVSLQGTKMTIPSTEFTNTSIEGVKLRRAITLIVSE